MPKENPGEGTKLDNNVVNFEKVRKTAAIEEVRKAAQAANAIPFNTSTPEAEQKPLDAIVSRFLPPLIDISNPEASKEERRGSSLGELFELRRALGDLPSAKEKKKSRRKDLKDKYKRDNAVLESVEDLGDRLVLNTSGFVDIDYHELLDSMASHGIPTVGTITENAMIKEMFFNLRIHGEGTIVDPYTCPSARVNWLRSEDQGRPVVFIFNEVLIEVNEFLKTLTVVGRSVDDMIQLPSKLERPKKVYAIEILYMAKIHIEGSAP